MSTRHIDAETFERSLPELTRAHGIIVDCRFGGGGSPNLLELLRHMIDGPVRSPRFQVPLVTRPDRRDVRFEENRWELTPAEPRLGGRYAFLIGPAVISAGETILSIVEHYRLGALVGEPTAGCNGNVNVLPLPIGPPLRFTAMRVLKHDGSQHHLVGIRPTHPVKHDPDARDDAALEKAMEILRDEE